MNRYLFISLLFLTSFNFRSFGYDFVADGIYYKIINPDQKEVEVTNNGTNGQQLADEQNKYKGKLVIPQSVKYNNSTYTVTSIDKYAFNYCRQLETVTLPNTIKQVAEGTFLGCDKLTGFYGKFASTDHRCLIDGNGDLIEFAQYNKTQYTIPNNVTSIGSRAFHGSKLESVTIPASVKHIKKEAFWLCSKLKSVNIPSTVATIEEGAFTNCQNLSSFTGRFASKDGRCLIYNGKLIAFAPKGLTGYTITDNVYTIGSHVFWGCESLKSLNLPSSITVIEEDAFAWCEIKKIVLSGSRNTENVRSLYSWNENIEIIGDNSIKTTGLSLRKAIVEWLDNVSVVESKECEVKFGIKSDSKIKSVELYVNGSQNRGINAVASDGYDMVRNCKISLSQGSNNITLVVTNDAGVVTESREIMYYIPNLATIDWLTSDTTITSKTFTLKCGIKSASKIISKNVTINGVETRGINAVQDDGYDMTIDQKLTLGEGQNLIRVEIKNEAGIAKMERNVFYKSDKPSPVIMERRIALVIGNANYIDDDKKLRNSVNDASDVADRLERLGFTVIRSMDKTRQEMEMAIQKFGTDARDYEVALFYYSGHGISCNGNNYLIPTDASLPEESFVKYSCTDANLVLDVMDRAQCKMKIMILDACRNNPFTRGWHRGADNLGLNIMNAPRGTFIAFSTAPGDVAQDGKEGERNSPYTSALLKTLDVPNLTITDFFQEVLEKVAKDTNERQMPWSSNSFRGKFVFNPK